MPVDAVSTPQGRSLAGSLLLGLALACSPASAQAETVETLGGRMPVDSGMKCYTRSFSRDFLAQHPKQRITAIALAIAPSEGADETRAWPYTLVVRMKGRKAALWQADSCEFVESVGFRCVVACDGGYFTLSAPEAGSGLRLDLSDSYTLQGGCGDDRKKIILSGKTEEPSYALEAGDMKLCRSQIRAAPEAYRWLKDLEKQP